MSLGTPVSLGSFSAAGSSSSIALTGGVNIVAGDLVVVCIGHFTSNTTTVSSLADGTNTYTKAIANNGNGIQEIELWYCANASAVTNPTFTVNFSAGCVLRSINAARVTGASALDKAVAGSAASTNAPTGSTGTLTASNEVVFGFFNYGDGTQTVTEGSGFTLLSNDITSGALAHLAYQVVSSNASVSYSPVLSGAASNCCLLVSSFTATPGTAFGSGRLLMGVGC